MRPPLLPGAVLAFALLPGAAMACACAKTTPAEIFARAPVIFVGVLVDAHAPLPLASDPTFEDVVNAREVEGHFFAHEMLKGTMGQVPAIVHLPGGSCGLGAVVPSPYLIVTDGDGRTSLCGGSHAIRDLQDPDVVAYRKLRDAARTGAK